MEGITWLADMVLRFVAAHWRLTLQCVVMRGVLHYTALCTLQLLAEMDKEEREERIKEEAKKKADREARLKAAVVRVWPFGVEGGLPGPGERTSGCARRVVIGGVGWPLVCLLCRRGVLRGCMAAVRQAGPGARSPQHTLAPAAHAAAQCHPHHGE